MSFTKFKLISNGQQFRYGDSITEYEIESDLPEEDILKYCTTALVRCSTPAGEEETLFAPFYEFRKVSENTYIYRVTTPYCD